MNDIELILFDLDGTLIDTAPDMVPALNELLTAEGHAELPYERLRAHVSHGSTGLLIEAFGNDMDSVEMERLRTVFLGLYQRRLAEASTPFPGIEALLARIEDLGLRWGVVTNKPGWLTDPLLKALDLHDRAACIVSGDSVGERKPHPMPLLHACELAATDPGSTVYVGDAERDVAAATAAGMASFVALFGYIAPGDRPEIWGAAALLEHPDDLWRHLPRHATATGTP